LAEIASLLKRRSAGKRHAFDSPAGKNQLGYVLSGLVAMTIEGMARRVKAAAALQVTSLEPDHGTLARAIDRATGQH
jgi:hypothetical protein